jgi:hypothetical protein
LSPQVGSDGRAAIRFSSWESVPGAITGGTMAIPDTPRANPSDGRTNTLGSVARIYWMLLGYGILGLIGATIAKSGPLLSLRDVGYWAVAVSIVAVRYVDVAYLHGTTAEGEPSTIVHWRRYAVVLMLVAIAVWGAAHGAAFVLA